MRKVAPIWWNEQPEGVGGFDDGGYWVVTKHKDVKEVSRAQRRLLQPGEDRAAALRGRHRRASRSTRGKFVLLNMDAPHHTHLRKIISRAFTPRAVERLRDELAERARDIAKAAAAEGSGDFVEQVSCELPLQAIAGLMGVPQEDRMKLFHWSNQMVGDMDPEFADNDAITASVELIMYGMQLAAERADQPGRRPRHQAGPGRRRGAQALRRRVRLLRDPAGGGGQRDHPQLDHPGHDGVHRLPRPVGAVQEGTPGTAADEIVRWATPVTSFQRTALEDTELCGVQIKKGQRVVMFYRSANFDEDVFDDPYTFNILRDPNPHVGFGGTGAHYCIGANLARMTIDLMFNAIADAHARPRPRWPSPSGCGRAGSTASSTGRSTTRARRESAPGPDGAREYGPVFGSIAGAWPPGWAARSERPEAEPPRAETGSGSGACFGSGACAGSPV